jgi:ATP-binding cassette subfamily C protein CydC
MAVWGSLIVGAPAVRAGVLDGTALAVVVLVPLAAFEAVQLLPTALLALARARSSGQRVLAILDRRPPVPEPAEPVAPLPTRPGVLRLRGASARWPDTAPDAPTAIAGVDLDLAPGRRVAVLGESGAGKSTLAAALLRFADLNAGSYHINGRDVSDVAGEDVRRVVGLCAQDAHVFDSTIRENLRLAQPGSDDTALRAALRRARLLPWVDRLPHGLDTDVGERGVRMSAGERQQLALARVLLADFPVLVLDEPTANLDPATAADLTDDLLTATTDRAVLLITHRLDGLERVDEILVVQAGRIVERGTHTELLQAKGRFHDLWTGRAAVPTPD